TYTVLASEEVQPAPTPPPPGGYSGDGSDRGWCEFVPGSGQVCYLPQGTIPAPEAHWGAWSSQATTRSRAQRLRVTEQNPLGKTTIYTFEDARLVSVEGVASQNCAARYKESEYDTNGYLD